MSTHRDVSLAAADQVCVCLSMSIQMLGVCSRTLGIVITNEIGSAMSVYWNVAVLDVASVASNAETEKVAGSARRARDPVNLPRVNDLGASYSSGNGGRTRMDRTSGDSRGRVPRNHGPEASCSFCCAQKCPYTKATYSSQVTQYSDSFASVPCTFRQQT